MVSHGRVELLAHPLSQKYLQMKWHAYGKYFHITNLLFYIVFLSIITCFSLNDEALFSNKNKVSSFLWFVLESFCRYIFNAGSRKRDNVLEFLGQVMNRIEYTSLKFSESIIGCRCSCTAAERSLGQGEESGWGDLCTNIRMFTFALRPAWPTRRESSLKRNIGTWATSTRPN